MAVEEKQAEEDYDDEKMPVRLGSGGSKKRRPNLDEEENQLADILGSDLPGLDDDSPHLLQEPSPTDSAELENQSSSEDPEQGVSSRIYIYYRYLIPNFHAENIGFFQEIVSQSEGTFCQISFFSC